ncbi:P-loop NTPase family protein [Actinoplanes sichuanensis]|uniref:Uncharacterized protein n=1 Tax=Actinoplanes sichuanensis TaxID=512349 RepID=A0ABW4A1M2_9ACTN
MDLPGLSGYRVNAFILDQTLDQQALGNRDEVLPTRTTGDRLVGVAAHITDVVDEIDNLLPVTASKEGSHAQRLTREQRRRSADRGYPKPLD